MRRGVVLAGLLAASCSGSAGDVDARVIMLTDGAPDAPPPDAGIDANTGPLPDLTVDVGRARIDLAIDYLKFAEDACERDEAETCISGSGERTLLRFAVATPNIGNADLVIGEADPDDPRFVQSPCHEHAHLNGFLRYTLVDEDDTPVISGETRAVCVRDSARAADEDDTTAAADPTYTCQLQGISRGWSAVYETRAGCQHIDVTGIPDGNYELVIEVDPDHMIDELDDTNNTITVSVPLGNDNLLRPTEACPFVDPSASRGLHRECGWQSKGVFECTPNAVFRIGCSQACSGLGTCTGDPMVRVCDVLRSNCTDASALGRSDDSCNSQCPRVRDLVCPDSGQVEVFAAPYAVGQPFTCEVELEYQ